MVDPVHPVTISAHLAAGFKVSVYPVTAKVLPTRVSSHDYWGTSDKLDYSYLPCRSCPNQPEFPHQSPPDVLPQLGMLV